MQLTWLKLGGAALAPVLLTIIFYLLDTRTKFKNIKLLYKQIIIGVVFGISTCLASQFGIRYEKYLLNVRSASPLTAGLIFGGPAGLIAGITGAIFRWFCVYWITPAPMYTRLACTLATVIAGVMGTLCRKYMFDNKKTSWFYGFFIAAITEVLHMLLVFFTHMDDIKYAFQVVQATAIIMILANSISLWLSLLFVSLISKEKLPWKKYTKPITSTFALYLLICIITSFVATLVFTSALQKSISNMEVQHSLEMNISDIQSDISDSIDRELDEKADKVVNYLTVNSVQFQMGTVTSDSLSTTFTQYCISQKLSEISICKYDPETDTTTIFASNKSSAVGFNVTENGLTSDQFLVLLDGVQKTSLPYQLSDYVKDGDGKQLMYKYFGTFVKENWFLIVGYDETRYKECVLNTCSEMANHRHIGQNGFLFILSDDGVLVSAPKDTVDTESIEVFYSSISNIQNNTVLSFTNTDGDSYYYMKSEVEGNIIVGAVPIDEAEFSRNISIYITGLLLMVIFFVLFITVYFLIKLKIVKNIHKINKSLSRISSGDLSEKIDIHDNEEFISLSSDINSTVERLKGFISDAEKRIDMELSYAKSIQHSVLPSVFPPYPNRHEFDIYAAMATAKEVGGDFYDFYLLGDNQLVFLVADVSGKGIPAAMFMMNAKSTIKNLTESGLGVSEVFTIANNKLCENNEAGMFVTAWMGILDLKTGIVKFANAGHNPPLIKHKNGSYEYFKSRPGLVLAGMEGIKYREGEFTLDAGDEIFLYTDGVTEANNPNEELFSEERLQNVLNQKEYESAENVCRAVHVAIKDFVSTAPRFDDITMLSLKYFGCEEQTKSLSVPAKIESIEQVTTFIDQELESHDANPKSVIQINVAIDELFGNIAQYAYPNTKGDATVTVSVQNGVATITFIDNGIQFNPLNKEDPDVTLDADKRAIGGLGIFMVKKTMDSVEYEYSNGKNVLTIKKSI